MEALLSPDKLKLFLLVAVPGIVALYVRAQFINGRMPPVSEGFVAYVTLSLVYLGLSYPLILAIARMGTQGWFMPAWFVVIFVIPGLLGLLLGLNIRKGWTKKVLARLGINTVHPVDSAWDYRFGGCEDCWILAVLKDGTRFAGYLGPQSFASSDKGERDLYIERVYEIGDDNSWSPRDNSVWIAQGEIRTLEFWSKS